MVFLTRIGPHGTYQVTFRNSDNIARNIQCTAVELGSLHSLIGAMIQCP